MRCMNVVFPDPAMPTHTIDTASEAGGDEEPGGEEEEAGADAEADADADAEADMDAIFGLFLEVNE